MGRSSGLFLWAVMAGVLLTGGYFWMGQGKSVAMEMQARRLTDTVFVREQVSLAEVAVIGKAGYRTLVSLRPDGEAPNQPSAEKVAAAAGSAGMQFFYVPVTPGSISDEAVNALATVLAKSDQPVLLYCRRGSRAARTWALAEASRTGGMNATEIAMTARSAGFPVDDIKASIEARIANRKVAR